MAETDEKLQADRIAAFGRWIEERRTKGAGFGVGVRFRGREAARNLLGVVQRLLWRHRSRSHPAGSDRGKRRCHRAVPPVQREMLKDLRPPLDAGRIDGSHRGKNDDVGAALPAGRRCGFFRGIAAARKESRDRPWSGMSEDFKVGDIIAIAQESGAFADIQWNWYGSTPGAHVLETIECEVDYSQLAPWRRDGLQRLRATGPRRARRRRPLRG